MPTVKLLEMHRDAASCGVGSNAPIEVARLLLWRMVGSLVRVRARRHHILRERACPARPLDVGSNPAPLCDSILNMRLSKSDYAHHWGAWRWRRAGGSLSGAMVDGLKLGIGLKRDFG